MRPTEQCRCRIVRFAAGRRQPEDSRDEKRGRVAVTAAEAAVVAVAVEAVAGEEAVEVVEAVAVEAVEAEVVVGAVVGAVAHCSAQAVDLVGVLVHGYADRAALEGRAAGFPAVARVSPGSARVREAGASHPINQVLLGFVVVKATLDAHPVGTGCEIDRRIHGDHHGWPPDVGLYSRSASTAWQVTWPFR